MTVEARLTTDCFSVAEACGVEIVATCSEALGAGDTVEFQFPNSWSLVTGPSYTRAFQTEDPSGPHYCAVTAPKSDARFTHEIAARQLHFPEHKSRHGRCIVATLESGTVPAGRQILLRYENTFAPYVAEVETVWLRIKGETPETLPSLTTRPGPGVAMRIITPSGVEPEQEFDVLIVSLDQFENASGTRFEDESLVLPDGSVVAEGLGFTGSVRVPVKLKEPGVYRFKMGDTVSNAVRVAEGCHGPYWGDIHVHTKLSGDAQGTNPYKYARNVSGLDFAAAMDHWDSLGPEGYRILEAWAEEDNRPGVFVTLPGDERNPEALTGHHNLYFRDMETFRRHQALHTKANKPSPEAEADDLSRLDPARAMLIPHHTGISWGRLDQNGIGCAVSWDAWRDPGLRPAIEIYSHHGQSEAYNPQHVLAYEFNRMRNPERRANSSVPGPFYAQDHWMNGWRIGVIASSDEHSGQAGRRHGGIAAVRADELTRGGIFDAIRRRRCYATTGERILIEFSVNGAEVGDCGQARRGDMLDISLNVWGTELLLHVEVLRYRFGIDSAFQPILSEPPRRGAPKHTHLAAGPQRESMDAAYEIQDEFVDSCMYYARVTQEPLEWPGMAWTSPVWIDVIK